MYYLVLLFAAAALLSGSRGANVNRHMKILAEMDHHIESNALSIKDGPSKKFISWSRKLPTISVFESSDAMELTCEALAAPAPTVHWFRNDAPVYEFDLESNEILDTNPTSLARITSTLLVPRGTGSAKYTCLVVAGAARSRASKVIFDTEGGALSERARLVPLAPRVLVAYKVLVDVLGSNVALPCRVRGHPRPHVVWRDRNNTLVTKNPRMKVLRSGELVISGLRWEDMGEYSCRAANVFGAARVTTFVYPAKPNGSDG